MATLLSNVIKKVEDEGFVKYENGQLIFKDGVIDLSGLELDPSTLVPKFAYASAIDGTGFTLTSNDTLDYMAIIAAAPDAVLTVSDFAGQWFRRRGLPGLDGTGTNGNNGEPGGIRMDYSINTVEEKPGTGKIRFNNTNIALATEMYVDEMIPSAVDLSAFWSLLGSGWYLMIKPATNFNSPLGMIEITGAPVDNGDWFSIPIQVLLFSSATFADGDKTVLQFFGGGGGAATVTEAAVTAAGNFTRFASNGAGGYKMIDNANVEVKSASLVYKLPSITISGVSNLPAANTFPHRAVVYLHQDNLVGAGANPMGIAIQADAINNKWLPFGDQVLFWKNFGTLAAPTLSLTAAGKFDLGAGGDPVIPAGLLNVDSRVRFLIRYRKTGTTAPTIRINFGTDQAARENNSIVYTQTVSATADIDPAPESLVTFITATTAICSNRAARGGGGAANSVIDAVTLLNIASAMKATVEASSFPAADTVYLLSFGIVWEG